VGSTGLSTQQITATVSVTSLDHVTELVVDNSGNDTVSNIIVDGGFSPVFRLLRFASHGK